VKKQNGGLVVEDVFEAARQAFFSGANGDAAASSRETFTQVKSYDGPVVNRAAHKAPALANSSELVAAR
jgi:hypothetical protein